MRRFLFLLLATTVGFIGVHSMANAVKQDGPMLPGARPTIDASLFSSLQAALDALPESGGAVKLPAGTFEIQEPLHIQRSDVSIEGSGSATHIKNVSTSGDPAIVIAHPLHGQDGNEREHELWRVRLANLRVTGGEASGSGIVAYNVNEIFIEGVTVSYHGGDGIHLSHCYEDPRVVNSLITYNQSVGLNLQGCHDIIVSANQFEENRDALHCIDGFNLCMVGNCLDDHLGHGVVIENTYGSVVAGNMIEECQKSALVMDRDCYGIAVSANVIAHNGAGVDLRDAHGCSVSSNTLTIMKTDAIRIGPASSRIAVVANTFSDSYTGHGEYRRDDEDRAAAGMVIDQAADVLTSSNLFSGVGPTAIDFSPRADHPSVITNNYIVHTTPGISAKELTDTADRPNWSHGSQAE